MFRSEKTEKQKYRSKFHRYARVIRGNRYRYPQLQSYKQSLDIVIEEEERNFDLRISTFLLVL